MSRDNKRAVFVISGVVLFFLGLATYVGVVYSDWTGLKVYGFLAGYAVFMVFLVWLSGRIFK